MIRSTLHQTCAKCGRMNKVVGALKCPSCQNPLNSTTAQQQAVDNTTLMRIRTLLKRLPQGNRGNALEILLQEHKATLNDAEEN